MRRTLYRKLILIYVILAIAGFTLISTVGSRMVEDSLVSSASTSMYREATQIASKQGDLYYHSERSLTDLYKSLSALASYNKSQIWLISADGEILLNTAAALDEENPKIIEAIRGFVYNGGGIIGVGEPSGHQYQGHFFQLANVFGVEEETGFTLGYDKYTWDEHEHFILEDSEEVDFGEGKKNIYALPSATILVQKEKEVQMAVNEFGKGRAVYISGLPYSFENSRVLYRAVLWSTHSEDELNRWFSTNYNVDVHAYPKNNKYCVVNNTYEPQDTTVYRGDGSSFNLHMEANEIKWYEI